jgi:class III signal peptide
MKHRINGQGAIEFVILFAIVVIVLLTLSGSRVNAVMSKAGSGLAP